MAGRGTPVFGSPGSSRYNYKKSSPKKGKQSSQLSSSSSSSISSHSAASSEDVKLLTEETRKLTIEPEDVLFWDDMTPGYNEHKTWLEELFSKWCIVTDTNLASTLLRRYFSYSNNPYRTALYLMSRAPDYRTSKSNTLAASVMKVFENWLLQNESLSDNISFKVQEEAFELLKYHNNSNLIQVVLNVYRLKDQSHDFVSKVKGLAEDKHYKQACIFATLLNIQDFFDIHEILVPLILQDKINMVQTYLASCPAQQVNLVKFVDSMSASDSDVRKLIKNLDIIQARPEKWNWRAFKKLGTRLMKLYNLSPDVCPTICQMNNTGALKYLLYKKYNEGSISDETWDEMIEPAVKDDVQLQTELVHLLWCYNDLPCAVKYAIKYNLDIDSLPSAVQNALRQKNEGKSVLEDEHEENWDDECRDSGHQDTIKNDYFSLKLPFSAIIFVDNKDLFSSAMDVIQAVEIVGIDSEWKPTFGLKNERLAVLQIATWDIIFLLDMISLMQILDDDDWYKLISIFGNPNIIKLGFGINADMKMITRSLPGFDHFLRQSVLILDLHVLAEKLQELLPSIFPFGTGESGGKGLTNLVQMCFEKSLNKSEQFSNWENRPLRKDQIIYAALDAYCLLEIHKHLQETALNYGIDWSSIITTICSPGSKKSKSERASSKRAAEPLINQQRQVENCATSSNALKSPQEFAVIVDTMLHGLGRQLRLMGVDTKISDESATHQNILQIALRENRVILTSGQPYRKLCQYVAPGMCYNVNQTLPSLQQATDVLNFFHVRVTPNDIFSRCQKCNSNRYIKVPSQDLQKFWHDSLMAGWRPSASTAVLSFDGGSIDTRNLVTDKGARLKFDGVVESVFTRVNLFYICAFCGKVYWEGSHLKRTVSTLKTVLYDDDDVD